MPYYRRKDGVVMCLPKAPDGAMECTQEQALAFIRAQKGKRVDSPPPLSNAEIARRAEAEAKEALATFEPPGFPDVLPGPKGPPAEDVPGPPAAPRVDFSDTELFPTKATLIAYAESVGIPMDNSMTRAEMETALSSAGPQ